MSPIARSSASSIDVARRPGKAAPGVLHVCLGGRARSRSSLARVLPLLARPPYGHPTALLTDDLPVLLRRASLAAIPYRVLEGPPEGWCGALRTVHAARALAHQVGARIVHAHGYAALPLGARIATRLRLPLLFSADDAPPSEDEAGLNGHRPSRAFTPLGVFAEPAERLLRCPVEVVPGPVDPRDYGGDHSPEQVAYDLALDPTTLHIGMVGDLESPACGGEAFVRAAARTLERIPFCEFVVIGEGRERDRMEALAHRERVLGRFRFLAPTVGLPRMLLALDAIAFPGSPCLYPWELLDAAASPVPLVVADHPVHREMLAGAQEVEWLPAGEVEPLATYFLRVLGRAGKQRGRADTYIVTRSAEGPTLVRARPSSTGYDLSSGELSAYEILADDFSRRRELVFRRHALPSVLARLSAAYHSSSETAP